MATHPNNKRITQSKRVTQPQTHGQGKAMNGFLKRQSGIVISLAIAMPLGVTATGQAQQALPPPPSVPSLNELPSLAPVPPPQGIPAFPQPSGYPQEAVFQAPMPAPAIPSNLYQVVVYGDSQYLLQYVRSIDPTASLIDQQGKRAIQVGSFNTEAEAQQRATILAQKGVAAQILRLNGGYTGPAAIALGMNPQPASFGVVQGSHYQVVVPIRPDQFATVSTRMISMGIKPEAIQAKRAPLGPHIAVGPIFNESEAESVSRYLRTGGMDARVYYAR